MSKTSEDAAVMAEIEAKYAEFRKKKGASSKHPMYATSSAVHGTFPKGTPAPVASSFGKSCKFSDLYVGGRAKNEGLITGLDKSRVHKAYDQSF